MKINLPRHDIQWSKPPVMKSKKASHKRRQHESASNVFISLFSTVPERFTLPENSATFVDVEMEEITNDRSE